MVLLKELGNKILIWGFAGFILVTGLIFIIKDKNEFSIEERRTLMQMPDFTIENVSNGRYQNNVEKYLLDQFPKREEFRRIKAKWAYHVMGQRENNGIYINKGYAGKLEYPLNEKYVINAANKMKKWQQKYFNDAQVYYSIIPDKNYFLAYQNGYPSIDYDRLKKIMQQEMTEVSYIDIWDLLSEEDYYYTDTHWRQEKLYDVADKIVREMGYEGHITNEYEVHKVEDFYGVYYGQSALSLSPDVLYYLTNDIIDSSSVWNLETKSRERLYDFGDRTLHDKYNIYLGGAAPVQIISSPLAKNDDKLIIFRDSFCSSLAPLLTEAYNEIILIDTRYIKPELLGDYVDFKDAKILFLYNTLLLNNICWGQNSF